MHTTSSTSQTKYTTVKPLADRVLLKTKTAKQKTTGGILLPSTAQSKPQSGEVVAVGEGRTIGDSKVEVGIKVQYSDGVTFFRVQRSKIVLISSSTAQSLGSAEEEHQQHGQRSSSR
ncbi:20 kDa chaperonin, chloroplastic [Hordeum vulgare]|nr:20 kDa chaperonin, chloroplastic [Hordeum vulgare]